MAGINFKKKITPRLSGDLWLGVEKNVSNQTDDLISQSKVWSDVAPAKMTDSNPLISSVIRAKATYQLTKSSYLAMETRYQANGTEAYKTNTLSGSIHFIKTF